MKKGQSYNGTGYILNYHSIPMLLYKYIRSLTDDIYPHLDKTKDLEAQRNACHHFIAHIYVSMKYENKKNDDPLNDLMIPVYCRNIEQKFKRLIKIRTIKKIDCIEYNQHNQFKRLSTEYRLKEKIFEKALGLDSEYVLESWKAMLETGKWSFKMVNLMNGNRIVSKKKHQKTALKGNAGYDHNRDRLIKDSIDCFEPCPFNPEKIYELVKAQGQVYAKAIDALEIAQKKYGPESPEYQKIKKIKNRAQGIFINDYTSLRTILLQQPTLKRKGLKGKPALLEYQVAYKVQVSGRLTEITGGFQGASQCFKELFLSDVPDIYNYDIKSSQAQLLLYEFEENGIKCRWFADYLSSKKDKEDHAKKMCVDVETWKKCLYSLIMGAKPLNLKILNKNNLRKKELGSIFLNILKHFDDDIDKSIEANKCFNRITKQFFKAVKKWIYHIYNSEDKKYTYLHKNIKYWKNACGMRYKDYGIKNFSYPLFSSDDVLNNNELILKLKDTNNPISNFILKQNSKRKIKLNDINKKITKGKLLGYLNIILDKDKLYMKNRFRKVHLSKGTKNYLNKYRSDNKKDLNHLNRLLIEDAFPGIIARKNESKGNSYLIYSDNPHQPIINTGEIHVISAIKRKLAAFTLQGQESCFIHHLTLLCKEKGIPVYKNEHDGLITGKEIPDNLVEQAAKAVNIKTLILKLKPICSDEKRNKMIKHLGKKRSSEIYAI